MAKYTEDQIADVAENACFYVTPAGTWLRMQWTDLDVGNFCATDEDTGEDYELTFAEVAEQDEPHFEELTRMEF